MTAVVWGVLVLGASLALGAPSSAWAQVSDTCAQRTEHVLASRAPNVLFAIDRSTSMNAKVNEPGVSWSNPDDRISRWDTARNVIKSVADAWGSEANLGYHFWSTTMEFKTNIVQGLTSSYVNSNYTTTSGGTQFHQGTQVIASEYANPASSSLLRNRVHVGIFLTDGIADNAWTTRRAVRDLCRLQTRSPDPVVSYAVGFGDGTDQRLNGLLGAAGGSSRGQCCLNPSGSCVFDDPAYAKDPCDFYRFEQSNGDVLVSEFEALLSPGELSIFQALYRHLTTENDSARTDSSLYGSPRAWRAVEHKVDAALDFALFLRWSASGTQAERDWMVRMQETLSWVIRHKYSDHHWGRGGDNLRPEQLNDYRKLRSEDDDSTYLHSSFSCGGGITAYDGQALMSELTTIFGDLSCTFPLALPPGRSSAPIEPKNTTVELLLSNGSMLKIPHESDAAGRESLHRQLLNSYPGALSGRNFRSDGWNWANPGRTAVQLSDNLCEAVVNSPYDLANRAFTRVCLPLRGGGRPVRQRCE